MSLPDGSRLAAVARRPYRVVPAELTERVAARESKRILRELTEGAEPLQLGSFVHTSSW